MHCQNNRSVISMCRNVLDVNKQYRNMVSRFDRNCNRIITERKLCRTGTENTTTLAKFWLKSRFCCTNILHALIDNAVHCTSGEGGMWEILVVTNMKKQPEKSGMTRLVHFCSNCKMTFRKVTPTSKFVNGKKFWQVQMTPWHMPSPILVHFAP